MPLKQNKAKQTKNVAGQVEAVSIFQPKQEWFSFSKGFVKLFLDKLEIPHCYINGLSRTFFLWQLCEQGVFPRHGTAAVTIHFLTLGWTAPLKSALEPDKGLDNLIKAESKPVYGKISHWTLFALLFYDCIKSGRKREDCCLYDYFFPNVSIIGNKWACSVKYNSVRFYFNTTTSAATQLKATVPGWTITGTGTTASCAAVSVRTRCCAVMPHRVAPTGKSNRSEAIL